MDVFESTLYWITRDTGELMKQDKFGRGVPVTVARDLANPTSVKSMWSIFEFSTWFNSVDAPHFICSLICSNPLLVYHQLRYNTSISDPCHNSHCSHLCLIVPGGHRCACPDGSAARKSSASEAMCDAGMCLSTSKTKSSCDVVFSLISFCYSLHFNVSASERERPLPRICPCQNGGLCREVDDGGLQCSCPPEYLGQYCDTHVQRTRAPGSGASTAAIVIPIVVILLLLLTAGAVYFIHRKRPL